MTLRSDSNPRTLRNITEVKVRGSLNSGIVVALLRTLISDELRKVFLSFVVGKWVNQVLSNALFGRKVSECKTSQCKAASELTG